MKEKIQNHNITKMIEDKILIKEILPYLSMSKDSELDLLETVKACFYRLKTGCQWREIPVKQFISRAGTTWNTLYYHFNKWCKNGSWLKAYAALLKKYQRYLDMSCVNLDGSHSKVFTACQSAAYNGRNRYRSTNLLFLVDNQGVILCCSMPVSGEHHDLYEITTHFDEILEMLEQAGLSLKYIFMNADAGFDSTEFRTYLEGKDIIANIDFNKRKSKDTSNREEYFDEILYKERKNCEHSFAWMDAYKALLIRYDKLDITWLAMNLMGMMSIFIKKYQPQIIANCDI